MATTEYENIPAPGYISPTRTYTNPEILSSAVAYRQYGVTLGPGQGVLPAGVTLGQRTADKRYYAYANTNTDGTETARGFLRTAVDTGTDPTGPVVQGNIVTAGELKLNTLTGLDAAAMTDLNASQDTVRGTLKF